MPVQSMNLFSREKTPNIDFIDNDFAIFDNIQEVPLYAYPTRLEAAVFAVCLTGSIRVGINLQEYTFVPKSLMMAMPDQIIQRYTCSDDFAGIFIVVSKKFIDEIIPDTQKLLSAFFYVREHPYTLLTAEELNSFVEYHSLLWKKVKMKNNVYRKEITQSLLLSLFYEVCNIFGRNKPQEEIPKSRKQVLFEQFMREMAREYKQTRVLSYYADKLCITAKYLSLVVKEVSGKSAGDWINEYVILEAKTLLKSSQMTIQEISDSLHFANQSFFGKYFKQHTGLSPKEYRKL